MIRKANKRVFNGDIIFFQLWQFSILHLYNDGEEQALCYLNILQYMLYVYNCSV